jgi:8-oxo-dGTP pyrophosphatase MutT (NUDIX family)
MKSQDPGDRREVWITPGGGIEQRETVDVCLRRELAEETGLQDVQIGPPLWTRFHEFEWDGKAFSQREEFYLIETAQFEPTMADNPAAGERSAFRAFRWWSVEDIRKSSELFAPRRLADLLETLIRTGPPETPFDVGI